MSKARWIGDVHDFEVTKQYTEHVLGIIRQDLDVEYDDEGNELCNGWKTEAFIRILPHNLYLRVQDCRDYNWDTASVHDTKRKEKIREEVKLAVDRAVEVCGFTIWT